MDAGGRGEEVVAYGGLDDFGESDRELVGSGVARVDEAAEVYFASAGAPGPCEDGADGSPAGADGKEIGGGEVASLEPGEPLCADAVRVGIDEGAVAQSLGGGANVALGAGLERVDGVAYRGAQPSVDERVVVVQVVGVEREDPCAVDERGAGDNVRERESVETARYGGELKGDNAARAEPGAKGVLVGELHAEAVGGADAVDAPAPFLVYNATTPGSWERSKRISTVSQSLSALGPVTSMGSRSRSQPLA
mmetsp:Transcript_30454/g.101841  ORF Transcript_30454/g.101841 Transcript_30454/m.101841 type:complete len:251 (-) Transcript_30454:179-931(-)